MPERPKTTVDELISELTRNAVDEGTKDVQEDSQRTREAAEAVQKQNERIQESLDTLEEGVDDLRSRSKKTHVDLGAEGVAQDASAPIDDALDKFNQPNTVISFPPGRYLIDEFVASADGLELQGKNATLVPTGGRSDVGTDWLTTTGDDIVVDGFEFDFRDSTHSPAVRFESPSVTFRNTIVRGSMGLDEVPADKESGGRDYSFVFAPQGGTLLVEDCYFPDGASDPDGAGNRYGFVANHASISGTIIYNRIWMEGWPNNTIYHHSVDASLFVRNSFFRNTDGGIRCGAPTDIVNCTFVRDGRVPAQRWWRPDDPIANMRGPWTTGADKEHGFKGTVRVEECDFVFEAGDKWENHTAAPIICSPIPQTVVLRNNRIDLNTDDPDNIVPIVLDYDGDQTGDESVDAVLEGNHILNRASKGTGIYVGDGIAVEVGAGNIVDADTLSNQPSIADSVDIGDPERASKDPPLPTPPADGKTP